VQQQHPADTGHVFPSAVGSTIPATTSRGNQQKTVDDFMIDFAIIFVNQATGFTSLLDDFNGCLPEVSSQNLSNCHPPHHIERTTLSVLNGNSSSPICETGWFEPKVRCPYHLSEISHYKVLLFDSDRTRATATS
jgi:hypothetical protein